MLNIKLPPAAVSRYADVLMEDCNGNESLIGAEIPLIKGKKESPRARFKKQRHAQSKPPIARPPPHNQVVPAPKAKIKISTLPADLQHPLWMKRPLRELIRPDLMRDIEEYAKSHPEDERINYLADLYSRLKPEDM